MIYHGIDIIEIGRIRTAVERWGPRFLSRVYTEAELSDCAAVAGGVPRYGSLAARWAAKEAAAKALGAGLRGLGSRHRREFAAELGHQSALSLHDIEVARGAQGQPLLVLHGGAAALALELQLRSLVLSLSHAHDYAVASVIGVVE